MFFSSSKKPLDLFGRAVCSRYYNWAMAGPIVMSVLCFHRPLPDVSAAVLCKQFFKNSSKLLNNWKMYIFLCEMAERVKEKPKYLVGLVADDGGYTGAAPPPGGQERVASTSLVLVGAGPR